MKELPIDTFDEIEDIIEPVHMPKNADIYGTKQMKQGRRMADTYKRVKEIANKYSTNDQDIDEMIQKYVSKKGLFNKRNPSTQLNRHK